MERPPGSRSRLWYYSTKLIVASTGSAYYSKVVGLVPCYPACCLRPAFVNHAPLPEKMRQAIRNKPSRLVIRPRKKTYFIRTVRNEKLGMKKVTIRKSRRIKAQQIKRKQTKLTFEPAAAVGGTSGINLFHLLVGRVPCYPACRLLPSLVHRGFS